MLVRLLNHLERQQTNAGFAFSVIVTDNDREMTGWPVVSAFLERAPMQVIYCCEPERNIALARNRAIALADGEFIAFIDDDEFPVDCWLERLFTTCLDYRAVGALGPVRPHFDVTPPKWLLRGRFCERPEHPTGTVINGSKCRTGNVLFRRSLVSGTSLPFDPQFGTGGEDKDFFIRMTQAGHVFVWCNEAIAYETVPPSRWTRRYLLKRALARGSENMKISAIRIRVLRDSLLAVPVYLVVVPFTVLFGQHLFMKYCIKLCDHLGRLLASLGINPMRERQM